MLGETSKDGDNKVIETMSPGMIQYLRPGQKVSFGTPQAGSGEADQLRSQYQGIAAGLGITYERLTGDLSQTNYSSIRAGEITYREGNRGAAVDRTGARAARARGRVVRGGAHHGGPRGDDRAGLVDDAARAYVDPSKEIAGNRNAIEGRLSRSRP